MKALRLAVLSDIHGNLPAFEAVFDDLREQEIDSIAVAGDLTSGVWSSEVVDRACDLARWRVAGNHEGYYLAYHRGEVPAHRRTGRQWAGIRWCYDHLSAAALDTMAALPEQTTIVVDGADPIRLFHGSPRSIAEHLYPDRNAAALAHFRRAGMLAPDEVPVPLGSVLTGVAEPVVVCGHSHIAWVQRNAGQTVVNAGSVGMPINGDWRAQYAVLTWTGEPEGWQVTHRAIPYDVARVRAGFEESGYLAEGGAFARAVLRNTETGLNWPMALLHHVHAYARAAGWEGDGDMPDALWDEAAATFDWEARL